MDESRRILKMLYDGLTPEIQQSVEDEPRLYATNRRFVYRFASGAHCRAAERQFNSTIRSHNLQINGKRIWASIEQRPEISAANRQVGAMCNALRDWMDLTPELARLKQQIAPAWGLNGHIRIGKFRVGQMLPDGGWEWMPKNLHVATSASESSLETLQMMS
jgi:hypothetical protein